MINAFFGYDARESDGFHVFVHSVISHATQPVSLVPLAGLGMPEGSNAFTLSRFLVPQLMAYSGHAIFCDGCDMLMQDDIAHLDALFDARYAVQVVKHASYATRHKTKYRGTGMECPNMDYPRKNWTSVMLMNCAHPVWRELESGLHGLPPLQLLQLDFLADDQIGALPDTWNRLVDEGQPVDGAKLLHWTGGMPGFSQYTDAPGAEHWHAAYQQAFVTHGR